MLQYIKAKYNNNAYNTVQKLYTLTLSIKTTIKKK